MLGRIATSVASDIVKRFLLLLLLVGRMAAADGNDHLAMLLTLALLAVVLRRSFGGLAYGYLAWMACLMAGYILTITGEFVLLLPGRNGRVALAWADRLREDLAARPFLAQAIPVTASLGVSEWSPGETIEALFEQADRALYRAKQCGRNKVVQWQVQAMDPA